MASKKVPAPTPAPEPGYDNGEFVWPVAPAAPSHAIGEHFVHQVKQSERWMSTNSAVRKEVDYAPHDVPLGNYSEYGTVTQPHPGIWTHENGDAPGGAALDVANKLVEYDHWSEHRPALTPLEARDLYRSYKNTPHAPASMFLKYLVHRFNHAAEYDDPQQGHKLDVEFRDLVQKGGASDKNGHVSIQHLHDWTRRWAPTVMPKLLDMRDRLQSSVRRGIGVNVRSINGEPYVALTRGLYDEMMKDEHPLSSHADKPETGFGRNMHHSWVPLKDLWFSYDLGDRYASGSMGAEDEWLVSNTGTRYQATPEDVQHNRVGDSYSNFLYEVPERLNPPHDDATDEQLANYVRNIRAGGYQVMPSLPMWLRNHKNAGPQTWAAVSEETDTSAPYVSRALHSHKWVPREYVMSHIASEGVIARAHSLKNPNLTAEDLSSLAPAVLSSSSWDRNTQVGVEAWMDAPKMNSHVLERAFREMPNTPATNHLLSSPLATPAMLQGTVDRLKQGWFNNAAPSDTIGVLSKIAYNPHHTPEQAGAIYNWVMQHKAQQEFGAADLLGTLKLPESALRDLAAQAKRPMTGTPEDFDRNAASAILSHFVTKNPHAAPVLAKLAAEGESEVSIVRLERRLDVLDRLEPELQPAYISAAEKSDAPLAYLHTLAKSFGLTQETVNVLAHNSSSEVRDLLFRNKSVTPEQIREAFPKSVPWPESPPSNPEQVGRDAAEYIYLAYWRRKNWEDKKLREHFVKPLPQNLAKSEIDMWQAHARDWLAQQQTHGFYYPTTRERALNIIRDGAIEPDLTDELLHGEAVFANRESPTFLDHWHKTAGPDGVVLYFETSAEPEVHGDGRFFWTDRVPVENAHIADASAAEAPLAKFHTPLTFPRLGIADDRRETKLTTTPLERQTVLQAGANIAVRENASGDTAKRLATDPAYRKETVASVGRRYAAAPSVGSTIGGVAGVGHPGHGEELDDQRFIQGAGTGASAVSAAFAPSSRPQKQYSPLTQRYLDDPTGIPSTVVHENLHRIFSRVQHKYGSRARETLASNLMLALPEDLRQAVTNNLAFRAGEGTNDEEAITELGSYLNVPTVRDIYHKHKQHSPDQQRAFHDKMKRAYRLLQAVSATADEGWLHRMRPWLRKGPALRKFTEPQGQVGLSAAAAHEVFKGSLKLSKAQPDLLDPNTFAFEYENDLALQEVIEERHLELELRKMAVIHDDPTKPMSVWRVENDRGEGPYNAKTPNDTLLSSKFRDVRPTGPRPAPVHDFEPEEFEVVAPTFGRGISDDVRFGFERPEHAQRWFGPNATKRLEGAGFKLKQVMAQKVWRSKSGKQVFFLPYVPVQKAEDEGDLLEKMSVFHDDPKNPKVVYRVEDSRGRGPYQNKYDVMPDKERDSKWATRRPLPGRDFPLKEWTQNAEGGIFGFARPEDAVEWFGPHRLARLKHAGFELREVLAQKAWLSNSGRQVVFQRPPPTQLGQAPAGKVVPVPKAVGRWEPHPEAARHVVTALRNAHDTHLDKLSAAYAKLPKPKQAKVEGLEDSFQQALSSDDAGALKDHPFVKWARTVVPEFGRAPVQKSEPDIVLPHEEVLKPGEESAAKVMLGHRKDHETALAAARFLVGRKEPVDEDMFRMALGVYDGDFERAALIAVGLTDSDKNLRALRAALKLGEFSPDHVRELTKNEPGTPHIESVEPGAPDAADTAAEVARGVTAGLVQPLVLGGKHSKGAMAVRDPKTGNVWLIKPGSGKMSPAAGARDDSSTQSAREAAFWHCMDKVGLGNYGPRADLLLVNGAQVAAMKLLSTQWKGLDERNRQVDGYAREVLAPYLKRGDVHRLAALLWTLGETDAHGQNVLVHAESIAIIDHGSAFAGPNFKPGRDSKSFTPYVLRVFGQSGYSKAKPEERVKTLPVLDRETDADLRKWVHGIDPAVLVEVMGSHGIGDVAQKAVVQRLDDLQRYDGPSLSAYVNGLWAGV